MNRHQGWQDIVSLPQIDPRKLYFLSTQDTVDRGWETMAFEATADHTVPRYQAKLQRLHRNGAEALAYHNRVIRRGAPREDICSD